MDGRKKGQKRKGSRRNGKERGKQKDTKDGRKGKEEKVPVDYRKLQKKAKEING